MLPRPPSAAVRDDPKRSAELAVYEVLDRSLSDGIPVSDLLISRILR
jgi:hypothetical protein